MLQGSKMEKKTISTSVAHLYSFRPLYISYNNFIIRYNCRVMESINLFFSIPKKNLLYRCLKLSSNPYFFWIIYSNISSKNCHGNQFYFFTFFENSEEPDWICQLMLLVALREEWGGRIIKLEKVYKSILIILIYLSSYHANFVFVLQDFVRETRVTFVIPMLNHFDRNVWR